MGRLNDYLSPNELRQAELAAARERQKFPTGWEPRVVERDTEAECVSQVYASEPDEVALLEGWLMDPDVWEIVEGSLLVNRWQMAGEWQYQYKAKLIRRRGPRVNIDELMVGIRRWKPPKAASVRTGGTLVVALSDWQMGKAEGGGAEAGVERILESCHAVVRHARAVRPDGIVVVGLGDLVEGCDGHYSSQTFTVELDRRQQIRVVRRLLRDVIVDLSRVGAPMVVSAVAGNHGEHRRAGKAFTGPGDNDDVAVMEQVAEVLQANPEAFGHVSFHIPDDRLDILLEIEGKRVGFTHGHIAGAGTSPQLKQRNYWRDHAFQQSALGDADYLVSGHYHHLSVIDYGPRVHFQSPSLDGGSRWWEDRGGGQSATGTLTFMITESGWDQLRVL